MNTDESNQHHPTTPLYRIIEIMDESNQPPLHRIKTLLLTVIAPGWSVKAYQLLIQVVLIWKSLYLVLVIFGLLSSMKRSL